MKKLFFALLCCTLLFTACGSSEEEVISEPETESAIETDEEEPILDEEQPYDESAYQTEVDSEDDSEETASVLGHTVLFEDVASGSESDVIGQRAYIEVSKDELKDMDEEQYSELCSYVETLDNNWFSVICDDKTGLVFTGCSSAIVTYGQLDDSGRIETSIGDIVKSGESFSYTEEPQIPEESQPDPAPDPVASSSGIETSEPEAQAETTVPESDSQPEVAAAVETPPTPEPEASTPVGDTVWLSATGSKYHRINNCGRMDPSRAREVSLDEAVNMGYERCSKCY